jgi:hypothetical protein
MSAIETDGKSDAIHDVIDDMFDARMLLEGKEDEVKDLKKREKECREKIQQHMVKENIGTFENVKGKFNITLYNSWSQQCMNKVFMVTALDAFVKENGNRLIPEDVANYVFDMKKTERKRCTKLTVRKRAAGQSALDNEAVEADTNTDNNSAQPKKRAKKAQLVSF